MISTLLSFSSALKYTGYILIAILVLLFMVLIHELGHYLAGKILKFKINEFSIGFGPKIFQKKNKSGELISLRAFPLGGYCAFEGETDENKDNPQAFNNQKPWKRLIVLFSGAFFNFLSAIIFSFILLLSMNYGFWQALGQAIPFTFKWAWEILVIFWELITGQLSIKALGGPVTTVKVIADLTQQNLLLLLLPLIAVNLAVFNLLPIPALDGFQMLFVAIEWIRKKPVKREVVNLINNIGLIVLFGFVIVVDILQFTL